MILSNLPTDSLQLVISFADQKDFQAWQLTDKKIRQLSLSSFLFKTLLYTHFRCQPSSWDPAVNQYLGIAVSRTRHGMTRIKDRWNFGRAVNELIPYKITTNLLGLAKFGTLLSLFDLTTKTKLHDLEHGTQIKSFAISEDGNFAASIVEETNALKLWNLKSGKLINQYEHGSNCIEVYLNHDGSKILLASDDETLKILDFNSGNYLDILPKTQIISALFLSNDGVVVAANTSGLIEVWFNGELRWSFSHLTEIAFVKLSKNNQKLFAVDSQGTVKVWDLQKGNCLKTLPKNAMVENYVLNWQICPDERTAYIGFSDGTIDICDLELRNFRQSIETGENTSCFLQLSSDGTTAFVGFRNLSFSYLDVSQLPHERIWEATHQVFYTYGKTA